MDSFVAAGPYTEPFVAKPEVPSAYGAETGLVRRVIVRHYTDSHGDRNVVADVASEVVEIAGQQLDVDLSTVD